LLRRGGSVAAEPDGERIEVGGLVIDKRRHEVIRDGDRIDLTPLEFQILELLASEPGRAWSRNALLDRVWSTDYEGYQRNIDPHINRLRKKLETDPKNPRYVLTVRGVGYKLNEVALMLWWIGSGLILLWLILLIAQQRGWIHLLLLSGITVLIVQLPRIAKPGTNTGFVE
jgi:DNA-binding winged helix-turn-helix (wHTH) protein